MKKIAFLLLAFFFSFAPRAHDVVWYGNLLGLQPGPFFIPDPLTIEIDPVSLFVGGEPPSEVIQIVPDIGFETIPGFPIEVPFEEPCTVYVNVDPPTNPLLGVDLEPNDQTASLPSLLPASFSGSDGAHSLFPALQWDVIVYLRALPTNSEPIQTIITGEWHASGLPASNNCDAVFPNNFVVPVEIAPAPRPSILYDDSSGTVNIDTKKDVALQVSDNLNGPYTTVGQGHLFSFLADGASQFYRGIKRTAGGVLGAVNDPSGKPQTDTTVGLPQGGPSAEVDTSGNFVLHRLCLGQNLLQLVKRFLVTDPITGKLGTNLATIEIEIPILKAYGTLNFKVEMQSFVIPVCNCTPWCSIGFASLDGSTTPIYFSGGANGPKNSPSCGAVEVQVTRPDGSTFQLKAGTGRHQNSGANPMPGTWKVTTKVCGQEKTCQISYP